MGLLSPFLFGQQIAPQQMQQFQQLPQLPQLPQQPNAQPVEFRPSLMSRFQGVMENPMFLQGMALLGNAQNGGNWGGAARDMMAINQQHQQGVRQQRQDQRDNALWGRQQTAWTQEDRQRADWEAAINRETDPQRQATLRALGPQGFGDWMAGEQQRAFQTQLQHDTQQFQATQGDLDRRNAVQVAGMRLTGANRPEGAGPGWQRPNGRDTMQMEDLGSATNAARQLVNSDIPRLRDLFSRMIEYDAQGRPLPASMQQTVNRYLQRHPEERAAFEQIESAIWPLVQQRLAGLAPITQFELGQAIARTPSANWTPQGVMEELDNMERAARLTIDLGQTGYDFQGEAGSLTTGRDAQGRSWMDVTAPIYERYQYRPPGERDAAARSTTPRTPTAGNVQPTDGDVRMLLQNSSAERRRQFDQVYGQGAAARVLRREDVRGRRPDGPMRRG